jgi:branched-chain amino acid transport system permease protein
MELLRSSLSDLPSVNLIIYGVFLILVMLICPGGLSQLFQDHLFCSENRFLRYSMNGRGLV